MNKKVVVLGGCGRVGFRFSLVCANKGYKVSIIDIDEEKMNEIRQGCLPHLERDAEVYLEEAIKKKSISLNQDYKLVSNSEVVTIALDTPVDSNLNPSLEPVAGIIFDISDYLKQNQLIIFRHTLSPNVVNRIKVLLEDKTGFKAGKDIYLAFAPEITEENSSIHDLLKLPQPIGAYDENSFKAAQQFFETITVGKISWLSPEEVLLGKLMKNMYSYVQNACANEFYLIAENYNANIHKILDSINIETTKSSQLLTHSHLPHPNPNSVGPGLHKEGWFLTDQIPFAELITNAFKINESMPSQIVQKLEKYKLNKVVILGMTNKRNSDDPRASLSYKLRKLLYYKNYDVGCHDPNLPEYADTTVLHKADAVILMMPHKEFSDLKKIKELTKNPNLIVVDLGGFWKETTIYGINGILVPTEQKANQKK